MVSGLKYGYVATLYWGGVSLLPCSFNRRLSPYFIYTREPTELLGNQESLSAICFFAKA